MPRMSAGYAKNTMRRALRAVVDADPSASEIALLWEYFSSTCAYCTRKLSRANREGHIDHLIPGGTNHISNRVLSCAACNGDEKRESDWLEFLKKKAPDEPTFRKRRHKIQSWCNSNAPARQNVINAAAQTEIDRAILAFDTALANLRQLRK